MIKTKKQMFTVIGAFILVMILGTVTYAFFNYTRTGAANTISTGRIYFDASQNGQVTLSDLFPISATGTITSETPGVGSLSIHVTGDTSYASGIEYLVKAVDVTSSTTGESVPISIAITYTANASAENPDIGSADENYFTTRGGNTSKYKILSSNSISNDQDLIVGYIAPGATGIDGYITILAYLDASNIAITDTYPEGTVYLVNENLTQDNLTACSTALSSLGTSEEVAAFCNGTGTIDFNSEAKSLQQALDAGDITAAQITALVNGGVVSEYTDGTTSQWVNNRTVFTTEEWNQLQTNGISFKIKVESNEGIWVPNPGSATLSLSPTSGTIDMSLATTTTSTITTNGNGTLSCISSDDTIATCAISNGTLTVSGVADGTATITVTEAAGTLYSTPATATFTVEVTNTP